MYHLSIVTPEKVIFEGTVKALVAPGSMGSFEILTDHAPIIATLKRGTLEITDKNNSKISWELGSGYLECNQNKVTVLADKIA